jgi:hypothetical protein
MAKPADMVARTESKDPEVGLRAAASLPALLERWRSCRCDARASSDGAQQLAELFGVSKQAVHQMYGKGERHSRRRPQ